MAVFSGVADLKKSFEAARARRRMGRGTLLFVDEIHRFNRSQQDSFLPVVEDGTVVLVGATTENPSFELNGALLSRCQVLVLRRLDDPALDLLLSRSETDLHRTMPLTPEARTALRAMADGDGRYLLNMAEQIAALPEDTPPMDPTAKLFVNQSTRVSPMMRRNLSPGIVMEMKYKTSAKPDVTSSRGFLIPPAATQ